MSGKYGLRHPRTTNERRAFGLYIDLAREYNELKVKWRRSYKNLVDAWDDILVSSWHDNGWKSHRKTQYRVTELFVKIYGNLG
jgi:hypothetical protein